jgi:hypothetical protein
MHKSGTPLQLRASMIVSCRPYCTYAWDLLESESKVKGAAVVQQYDKGKYRELHRSTTCPRHELAQHPFFVVINLSGVRRQGNVEWRDHSGPRLHSR